MLGRLRAAISVAMTLLVFVLLAIKYAEVAIRDPEGGGVVTVSTRAVHPFVGLVGGISRFSTTDRPDAGRVWQPPAAA